MDTASPLFLALDLTGVFAFALNGALTAIRVVRLDVVGVITLGMITALGGGIVRDIFIDDLPPATFSDWRYLSVAATGSLVAFLFGTRLDRWVNPIMVLDAAGLSLFAVAGALKTLEFGGGPAQAVILGTVTAVGGGTIRDVLVGRVPVVLRSELYAIPALAGALSMLVAIELGAAEVPAAIGGASLCLVVRLLGVHFRLEAPVPRSTDPDA
ncbi:trimeric intracellular cation channel family protein [Nocardioides sp. TF02-7]|uniref:trimeric intracellular cation channel family protein n=1 Tax=Nocardioides sp. TF02-7 TaxID=2917724 RepID=UPI001F051EB5|nr:trimeric intracellular cation channel family protein [Nocardioides sp. TF02-7]UMG91825.1 trimeric intracellular cation channel family protein [Nocardioides sp. TF02-7]